METVLFHLIPSLVFPVFVVAGYATYLLRIEKLDPPKAKKLMAIR